MRFAALCVLGLWVVGCAPTGDMAVKGFKAAVQDHFRRLEDEGQQRRSDFQKDLAASKGNPLMGQPTGMVYDTYTYDPKGFVVLDYSCRVCRAKLVVTAPAFEYLCPACGHSPYLNHAGVKNIKSFPCEICGARAKPPSDERIKRENFAEEKGAQVKDMFELTSGEGSKGLAAKVRYVRMVWTYDPEATVPIPAKVLANVKSEWIPTAGGMDHSRPGFHRLDAAYVGEMVCTFRGGVFKIASTTERAAVPSAGYHSAP